MKLLTAIVITLTGALYLAWLCLIAFYIANEPMRETIIVLICCTLAVPSTLYGIHSAIGNARRPAPSQSDAFS